MSTTNDKFRLADIGGELGVGEVGHQIVDTLSAYDSEALQAALMKEANQELTAGLTDDDRAFVDSVADGELISCSVVDQGPDAVVVYMERDHRGDLLKGCIPLASVRRGSRRGHVSQAGELQKTAAAHEQRERAAIVARAAEDSASELEAENERLRRLLDAAQSDGAGDAAREAADARAKAEQAQADAERRAEDLAAAEREREEAERDAAEKDREIAELKRQLEQAQEAATAPTADGGGPPPATPGAAAAGTRPAARRGTAKKS